MVKATQKPPAKSTFHPHPRPPPPHKTPPPSNTPLPLPNIRPRLLSPFRLPPSRRRLVVEAAEECFTRNDVALANRPSSLVSKQVGYDSIVLVFAPYGDHWRHLCRICTLEIFSSARLNSFSPIRRDEIRRLLLNLNTTTSSSRDDFTMVVLRPMLLEITFNIVVRMMTGKRYYGKDVTNAEEATSFREMVSEILKYADGVYPGDFLCILRLVFRDYEQRVSRLSKTMNGMLQKLIEEHRGSPKKGGGRENRETMVDHLLSLQETQPEYYTDEIIKGLMQVMFIAGTETSALTMEWAMSHLLNHPHSLEKVTEELDSVIGQERLIEETDITKLPYLENIVAETLRLTPPAPLLIPHMSSEDCTIGGYNVPRQTMVFINAWNIHRDDKPWDDPTSFKPERFENGDIGQYKYLPFGVGRRACPGANMAQRMISVALGLLIQCFEWKRIREELVDMTEGQGISMPKAVPLEAMCKPREIMARIADH